MRLTIGGMTMEEFRNGNPPGGEASIAPASFESAPVRPSVSAHLARQTRRGSSVMDGAKFPPRSAPSAPCSFMNEAADRAEKTETLGDKRVAKAH